MKKIVFLLALVLTGVRLNAQQDHQYTQFMYNKLLLNPGYAGARGVPSVTGIYRNQWAGFDGAPKSFLVSFNSPFLSKRVGVGVTLSQQQAGFDRDFFASLAYSYDLISQDEVSLRVGIQGSLRSFSIDFAQAQPGQTGDPSLDNQKVNDFYGNVGAGIYATFVERFYLGFSVPRIYTNSIGFSNPSATLTAKEARHYYGTAGAIFPLGDGLNLMPAILLKYVANAPFDADLNLNLDIRQKLTAGISYRLGGDGPGESVDLLVFWQATPQVGIGAAYDFTLSQIRDYTAGSFEVLLQADLKKKEGKKKFSNPRFFL
ncbi:MAG: type IX secretion system membrane protein PorP/SprF [Saprospiraceae bacterium]